jgi:hypothetical protein
MINHPWGFGPCDLSDKKLTGKDKDFLADLVINKLMKSNQVAIFFNISKTNIQTYTHRRRVSNMNYDNEGRYKKIDNISDCNIKEALKDLLRTVSKKIIIEERLRPLIRDEARKSFNRKHPHFFILEHRKKKILSYNTLIRYFISYQNFIDKLILKMNVLMDSGDSDNDNSIDNISNNSESYHNSSQDTLENGEPTTPCLIS